MIQMPLLIYSILLLIIISPYLKPLEYHFLLSYNLTYYLYNILKYL